MLLNAKEGCPSLSWELGDTASENDVLGPLLKEESEFTEQTGEG